MPTKEPKKPLEAIADIFAAALEESVKKAGDDTYRADWRARTAIKLYVLGEMCNDINFFGELLAAARPKNIPVKDFMLIVSRVLHGLIEDPAVAKLLKDIR